ncbi:MAG: hypothetical protein BMS9Abin19_0504 [Gammaproteobacteria bacterium]|nr:MAG: hypothetical protein BMS9Abin19_0504 [Gammaproteobacteria bacterium]
MKRIFLFALFMLFVTGCEFASQNPLLGRWQSDEKATLVEARNAGLTEQQLQQLENEKVFGRLIAIIDKEKIVFNFEDRFEPSPYRILKIEKQFVDIELFNSSTKAYETTRIETHGDRMWVPSAMASFREVFVRID